MKYTIYVSSRKLVLNKAQGAGEDDTWDWDESEDVEETKAGSFETLQECFDDMSDWGSRWVMYPSVYIVDAEGSEVWESTLNYSKCNCCGHEEYFTETSNSLGMPYKEFEEKVANGL